MELSGDISLFQRGLANTGSQPHHIQTGEIPTTGRGKELEIFLQRPTLVTHDSHKDHH